jgi:GGDEF domain-containing protein
VKRLRLTVAVLIIWLFFFYNIERFIAPINITGVSYALVPLIVALIISIPHLRRVPLWAQSIISVATFLVLKEIRYRVGGGDLPWTVTEACAIVVTVWLAHLVSDQVSEFENALARITIGHDDELSESFLTGQAEMYRELRRARHHNRPLALMAIGIEEQSLQVALDRMVKEVQQTMMRRYVLADVSKTLCDALEDYNIIARDNDHFLVLLPEVTSEEMAKLVDNLYQTVSKQVGVIPKIGTASYPNDAVTFDSLVEKAIENMKEKRETEPRLRLEQLVM